MSKEANAANAARDKVARVCDSFIPEDSAQFIWDDDGQSAEAFVALPQGDITGTLQMLSSSTGADTEGWPDAPYNNPFLIFGQMMLQKWKSTSDFITALSEIAKIDSAEWARKILQGMAWSVGSFAEEHINFEPIESIADVDRFRDEIIAKLQRDGRQLGVA